MQKSDLDSIIEMIQPNLFTLQVRKLRLIEVATAARGHRASQRQGWLSKDVCIFLTNKDRV